MRLQVVIRLAVMFFVIGAAGSSWAAPELGVPTLVPQMVPPGLVTLVTVSIPIKDPSFIAGSAVVQRLNNSGLVTAVLGTLHDDGIGGDQISGDGILTVRVPVQEAQAGEIALRVSAAFRGMLKRVESLPILLAVSREAVTGVPLATSDDKAVIFRNSQGVVISTIPLMHTEATVDTPDGPIVRLTDEQAILSPDQTRVGILTAVAEMTLNGDAEAVLSESRFRYLASTGQLWTITAPPRQDFWLPTGSQLVSMHGTRVVLLLGNPTGEGGQRLRVYSESGAMLYELPQGRFATIAEAHISPDGRYLLVSGHPSGQPNFLQHVLEGINIDTGVFTDVPYLLSDAASLAIDTASDGRFLITLRGQQAVVP